MLATARIGKKPDPANCAKIPIEWVKLRRDKSQSAEHPLP